MAIIHVEEKINQNLEKTSKIMGIKKRELVDRALLYYFESIKDMVDLKREFDAWDRLSDEAMRMTAKSHS
ncbi:MAG: hypothetical protein AAB604_03405 [Patescibacteria group bacterium]